MKTGVELIAKERWNQVYKNGFTKEHDSNHDEGELAKMAAAIAVMHTDAKVVSHDNEPLEDDWCLFEKAKANKIYALKVAGALIAAEIDRLQEIDKQYK